MELTFFQESHTRIMSSFSPFMLILQVSLNYMPNNAFHIIMFNKYLIE